MKKSILSIVFLLALAISVNAQLSTKGILLRKFGNHEKGDTIIVYGYYKNGNSTEKYAVNGFPDNIKTKDIRLLNENQNFWERVWFKYKGATVKNHNWEYNHRTIANKNALNYYFEAKNNDILFEDELLYDYIQQLLLKIHPTNLIKPKKQYLTPLIIKSNERDNFTFDNGFIVLTTGLIASLKSEEELIKLLSRNIARVVLEPNMAIIKKEIKAKQLADFFATLTTVVSSVAMINSNYKNGTNYHLDDAVGLGLSVHFLSKSISGNIGANYFTKFDAKAKDITREYLQQTNLKAIDDDAFTKKIANTISYTAWQQYHAKNYNASLLLAKRLEQSNVALDLDYLLLSKLYRAMSSDEQKMKEALAFIKKAKEISDDDYVEFHKEEGIIYLRLNQKNKAMDCFINYKTGLLELEKQGTDISKELDYVNQILRRN